MRTSKIFMLGLIALCGSACPATIPQDTVPSEERAPFRLEGSGQAPDSGNLVPLATQAEAVPAAPPSALEPGPITLPIDVEYLRILPAADGATVYVEGATREGLVGYGLTLSDAGQPTSPLTAIAPPGADPFGDVVAMTDGLLAAFIRGGDLELWRWGHIDPPELLLTCDLAGVTEGDLLADQGDVFLIYESGGDLLGHRTSLDDPHCPNVEGVQVLAAGQSASTTRAAVLGGHIAVVGLYGHSYAIRLFTRQLDFVRQLRLAPGGATSLADLALYDLESDGQVAVFAAHDLSREIFVARLDQLVAGPLPMRRLVSTGDVEQAPHIYPLEAVWVVTWQVRDALTGELLLLGSLVDPDDLRTVSGGEVLWRQNLRAHPHWAVMWSAEGALLAWIEEGEPDTLSVEHIVPGFWAFAPEG